MAGWLRGQALGAALAGLAAVPSPAQETTAPASPILTIDQERLYGQSLWGKRAEAEITAESQALQAENNRIEAELTAEEKSLTERRPTMPAPDFRKLADDFDQRVTGIRTAQDRKAREIAARRDQARQDFFNAALPVMADLLRARGAVAILDNRAVFVSARSIDATDDMRQRLDEVLGAGPDRPAPPADQSQPGATPPADAGTDTGTKAGGGN